MTSESYLFNDLTYKFDILPDNEVILNLNFKESSLDLTTSFSYDTIVCSCGSKFCTHIRRFLVSNKDNLLTSHWLRSTEDGDINYWYVPVAEYEDGAFWAEIKMTRQTYYGNPVGVCELVVPDDSPMQPTSFSYYFNGKNYFKLGVIGQHEGRISLISMINSIIVAQISALIKQDNALECTSLLHANDMKNEFFLKNEPIDQRRIFLLTGQCVNCYSAESKFRIEDDIPF